METDGATSIVLPFVRPRDLLNGKSRQQALPELGSLILAHLDRHGGVLTPFGDGSHSLDERVGPFTLSATWFQAGRYYRVDRGTELLFSAYYYPGRGHEAMTWKRSSKWESELYDAIKAKEAA